MQVTQLIKSRQRRAHAKSRLGCTRCKRLRKKCDETLPSCLRCVKQNIHCIYHVDRDDRGVVPPAIDQPQRTAEDIATEKEVTTNSTLGVLEDTDDFAADGRSPCAASMHNLMARSRRILRSHGGVSVTSPASDRISTTLQAKNTGTNNGSERSAMLSSYELELFSHYITHTSRAVASDEEDMFALQVGIPNLALTDTAIMGSIIALAAACRCHDLLNDTSDSLERLDEMEHLLAVADHHHQRSLGQLQQDLGQSRHESVLANAPLMVLYALSAHCGRVLLTEKAKRKGISLPSGMLPSQSQWITSIRAAHVAHVGILQPTPHDSEHAALPGINAAANETAEDAYSPANSSRHEGDTCSGEDGPSEETRRLLLPIISATYQAALMKLQKRTEVAIATSHAQLMSDAEKRACAASVGLLEELFSKIVGTRNQNTERSVAYDFGILPNTAPWLTKYVSRVTSASPSKLWRRTTMAFLNKVPLDFLQMVQSALDCIPTAATHRHRESSQHNVVLDAMHRPAMDIFAHWLVLVMLLDGVWWIGGIGHWELGRLILNAPLQGWIPELGMGDSWWPETMHALKTTLAPDA